jgi:hypothetical protein
MSGKADGGSGGSGGIGSLPPLQEVTVTDHPIQSEFKRPENPEEKGSMLWLRDWKLSIGTAAGGTALDLSQLAFSFSVEQGQYLTPWPAKITVHNLGDDVISRMEHELTFLSLDAGYKNSTQYGKVFGGPIAYYRYGRRNATDTFVDITAVQNDQPLSAAFINTWLPAGHTKEDIVKALADAAKVDVGQINETLKDVQSPRGRALYGMVSAILRDLAATVNGRVFIDSNQKLHVLAEGESLKFQNDTVPILNSKTGLIDIPAQELGGGISIRSLLNPSIIPGGQIKVNQKDITQFKDVNTEQFVDTNWALSASAHSIKADGYYLVTRVRHWGENRGNPWYSDITSEPYDPSKLQVGIRPSV